MNLLIRIDTREQWRVKAVPILLRHDIKFTFEALSVGDYLLETADKQLLIERKSTNDFLGSIGTLAKRIPKMAELPWSMLLIEGKFQFTDYSNGYAIIQKGNVKQKVGVTKTQIRNFILSLQMKGVDYYTTNNYSDTIHTLCTWHKYLEQGIFPMKKRRKFQNSTDRVASVWSMFEGIGKKTIKRLLDKTTLKDVATMNVEEINAIVKNKKTAKKMYDLFQE